MIVTLKAKNIIAICLIVVFIIAISSYSYHEKNINTSKYLHTIVIDAGHGGRDNGTVTKDNSVKESDVNLLYAFTLQKQLKNYGFNVVLTRKDKNGLYSSFSQNHKLDDMNKRKDIILKANPTLVISLHTNYFNDSSQCGAQTFYQKNDSASLNFATNIQTQFKNQLNSQREVVCGDYYICNSHPFPSVICECGFLSNENDVEKIISDSYRNQYCYSIVCGIITSLIDIKE